MAAANQTNRMGGLGANGEVYKPIIMATPGFEPEKDAERIEKAMKGMGTDEKALIDVLCRRTAEERGQIAKTYKSLFGKDLIKRIKSETSGNFGKCMRYLCLDAPTLRAKIIFDCIDGAGTDELGLIEILCSATNYEISEIRDAYRKVLEYKGKDTNKRNLEKDLVGDTSGFFRRIMVAIAQGERIEPDWSLFERAQREGVECLIDRPKAMEFAKKLYEAGEGKLGTDEACFIRILGHESVWMIAAIDQAYQSLSKRTLRDAIKSEMSGDLLAACLAVLDFSLDRPSAFAQRLNKAIKGLGTRDDTLIRICCTRADVDMCEIKESYRVQFGRTLAEDIKGDTSGDYKHALLALIGEY